MPPYAKPERGRPVAEGILSAAGPKRAAPKWPLGDAAPEELATWRDLWRRPVAILWHEQATAPQLVARYVRLLHAKPGSSALTPMENALALTPMAMARLHLRVEPDAKPPRAKPDPRFAVIDRVRGRREADG
jgi:hypothetical protein